MAIQMTRAEYEKKYGTSSVVAPVEKVDTLPSMQQMTRAEYEIKYGKTTTPEPQTKKIGFLNIDTTKNPFTVSNPLTDIRAAGADVEEAIAGTGKYAGQGAIRRGTSAAATAAMAVPTAIADVIPGGKSALEVISKGFEGAIGIAGNISQTLADTAQKIGIMTPEQRKQYDTRNADFANSPTVVAMESTASVAKNLGDISMVLLMAKGTADATQRFIDRKLPEVKAKVDEPPPPSAQASMDAGRAKLVQEQANEIAAIEGRYAKGRKANIYSKDEGASSRERIAETGVLKNSVDENGLVRTTHQGGAVDQYKAMTVKPAEGVVRANLVREGNRVNLAEVQKYMEREVNASGLEGADLIAARNGIKREIAGLRLKADSLGYVDATLLHDAKINTTNNINYQTPPETATYRKAVARAYKTLVEDNSGFDVKGINAELAKYYEDIARLERLDGARVLGGRLGKYTSQITGTIIGGAVGGLFGGLGGAAIGGVVGGEISGFLRGKAMTRAITEVPGKAPVNPVIEKAIEQSKQPQSSNPKSTGSRNLSQTINKTTAKTSITPNPTILPSTFASLAEMKAAAPEAKVFIDAKAKAVAESTGNRFVEAPIKTDTSIAPKLKEDDINGDHNLLNDLARNTIALDKPGTYQTIINQLTSGLKPDEFKVKKQTPEKYGGYEGTIVNIKTPNGLNAEVQITSPRMLFGKLPLKDAVKQLGQEEVNRIAKETGLKPGVGHDIYYALKQLSVAEREGTMGATLRKQMLDYFNKLR